MRRLAALACLLAASAAWGDEVIEPNLHVNIDIAKQRLIKLEAVRVTERDVWRALGRAGNRSGKFDDRLRGEITLSLHDLDLGVALTMIAERFHAVLTKDGLIVPAPDFVWFEAKDEPIQRAAERLLSDSDKGCFIDPDVTGCVTIRAKNTGIDEVLDQMAKQTRATVYRGNGETAVFPIGRLTEDADNRPVRKVDDIVPRVLILRMDVRDAIRRLMRWAGVSYSIAPEVQGTVTLRAENLPLRDALSQILDQVEAKFVIEGGVYQFMTR